MFRLSVTALAAVLSVVLPASTAAASVSPLAHGDGAPFLDARERPQGRDATAPSSVRAAAERLGAGLGRQGVVELDARTGTPRQIARLDGFLTGPSSDGPVAVARDYVREHREALGLDVDDLARLELAGDSASPLGVTHVTFAQTYGGIRAFDNFVRVNVARGGQVVNVVGSPAGDLSVPSVTPSVSADAARAAAMRDAGAAGPVPKIAFESARPARATRFEDDQRASLVLFAGRDGARLAWRLSTVPAGPAADYLYVIDAQDARVLWRQNLTHAAQGRVWDYYPAAVGTPQDGHSQTLRAFPADWLSDAAAKSNGSYAHVYSDVSDDNRADAIDEVQRSSTATWDFPVNLLTSDPFGKGVCVAVMPCSWKSTVAWSWGVDSGAGTGTGNRRQNATQVFYYLNRFHDWLEPAPFGFDSASGNFEGADKVEAETLDGANTSDRTGGAPKPGAGFPDALHLNNANMSTPPDGQAPRMQMYLFAGNPDKGLPDLNGGDDASVVYHEYTHGLSSRLVSFPDGSSGLVGHQSDAMGEGWSDWYAMDYLFAHGFDMDAVNVGFFVNGNRSNRPDGTTLRSQPLNCEPGSATSTDGQDQCLGTSAAGNGGYTYGDLAKIVLGPDKAPMPESHGDGEIWAQTLWQLRERLRQDLGNAAGLERARLLITEAMRLSPPAPSFLDMRNAILAADTANGGADRARIWDVFRRRGMGFFASALGSDDTAPVQDFSAPPTGPGVVVTGRVTDADTHAPVAGAAVGFGGHFSDLGSDLAARTDANGNFSIANVPPGTYPQLLVFADGYDDVVRTNVVIAAGTRVEVQAKRDWAARDGGAQVTAFTGLDAGPYGCGPAAALDGRLDTGWVSGAPNLPEDPGAKSLTIKLPAAVDVSAFAIAPGGGPCNRPPGAAVGPYKIETSRDGTSFAQAAAGTFGPAANDRRNSIVPAGAGRDVRYVRFTMQGPQDAAQPFMMVKEIEVYGVPAARDADPTTPGTGTGGQGSGGDSTNGGVLPTPDRTAAPPPEAALTGTITVGTRRLRAALDRGLVVRVAATQVATATVTVTLDAATARKLRHRGIAGRATRAIREPGRTVAVGVPLSRLGKPARRALLRLPSARFVVTVRLTGPDGATTTLRRNLRLGR